ncbi:MAG: hypothetical protein UZ16_OP3001003184 [Candidatus Hinthialibacteria bacterium OLB16]|nr:MAG: hypothetical protein UZ16_OP3001003184 [Candidatus Hinthialibacteria bacterium OLB16]
MDSEHGAPSGWTISGHDPQKEVENRSLTGEVKKRQNECHPARDGVMLILAIGGKDSGTRRKSEDKTVIHRRSHIERGAAKGWKNMLFVFSVD